ncbi:dipeptidyl-peptidase 3 family protein [Membranihabitans maritimus]|uniref:dipeptidyl-peptidase 3 family protein n=1 Tax=Membranihabitans maritimus TaxID=2904244 RepID=UPI001F2D3A1E|nr:hypothetical protein [Membranihabitans maritimus]
MRSILILLLPVLFLSCQDQDNKSPSSTIVPTSDSLINNYTSFTLTSDLSHLSENQKKMIPLLIETATIMDDLFWIQAYGDKNELLSKIEDSNLIKYTKINYGPWDRLNGNTPFIENIGPKPAGANLYPKDITKEDLENAGEDYTGLYSMVRRDEKGTLEAIPYSEFFGDQLTIATSKLQQAANLAEDPGFKKYLQLRAKALLSDDYLASDMAWMDMKENDIDFVVGPIETYEDQLLGAKAAFEAYVLIKDKTWSKRLSKYAKLLPQLQKGLPVSEEYKKEVPGTDSDLNAYDAIYYAGDCNAGSKTIAINLPNDEKVQLEKGTRRLQLKNAMQAKFDKILVPISKELIIPEQREHITFDAFFGNTMFHEVAHGLGIKNTINGKGTVREALKEQAGALEEGKADILGLYMITKMAEIGEFPEEQLMDNYVTFLASIFRSSRFGASSAHGRANMLRFNYFEEKGAFSYDESTGHYSVDFEAMQEAMKSLSELILTIQGNGDYEKITQLMEEKGQMGTSLQKALDRVNAQGIPVDVVFEQGVKILGL